MEGFIIWGCHLILSVWRWINEPQVGVCIPYGELLTRGTVIFVLLELHVYGSIYDPGTAPCPPRIALA